MSRTTRIATVIGTGAILAVPTVVLAGSPAQADVERQGVCGGGVYELSVDREGRGFEVDGGLEYVAPGSRWRIRISHDGTRFVDKVLRADREGDLDLERYRANTAGADTFTFRADRVGGVASCTTSITVR